MYVTEFEHRNMRGTVFMAGDGSYFGQVLGAISYGQMVSFYGETLGEAKSDFRAAVDEYLD